DDPIDGRPSFACDCTPDAQAAFDLARTNDPDLILIDGDVDDASELVEALLDDVRTERTPIVVIGSFLEPGEAAKFVGMGVRKTIGKPTSREALRALCEKTLEKPEAAPIVETPAPTRGNASEVRLQGRRVVVADDDPAIVWFIADTLKTS